MKVLVPLAMMLLVSPQAALQNNNGTITGSIRHASTDAAIAAVTVTLRWNGGTERASQDADPAPLTAATDANGNFVFKSVPPGSYLIPAPAAGYAWASKGGGPRAFSVAPRQQIKDVALRWLQSGAISGRVLDFNGVPLVGVTVHALESAYANGQRRLDSPPYGKLDVRTDDRGEYRLFGFPPGEYYLRMNYEPQDIRFIYYPGTFKAEQASSVSVPEAGDARAADMTFPAATDRGVKLSGKVIDEAGVPRTAGSIMVHPRDANSLLVYNRSVTYANLERGIPGQFELRGIRPGLYDVFVLLAGPFALGRTSVNVRDLDIGDITLVVRNGIDVKGRVVVEGNDSGIRPESLTVELTPNYQFTSARTKVGADATFTLERVPEETYRIAVGGLPRAAYAADIRQGSRSIYDSGLTVTRNPEPIQVIVNTNGGTIEGVVQDAARKVVAEATVALIPEASRRHNMSLYRSTTADEIGRFTLTGILPGSYKLFAWEDIPAGAFQNAEFLAPDEAWGAAITVDPASRFIVTARAIASRR